MASTRHRDAVVNRLLEILEIACQGWLENLPTRSDDPSVMGSVRRQRIAIHDFKAEAQDIVKHYYPPKVGDE